MKILTATIFTSAAYGAATMMCLLKGDWFGVVLGAAAIVLLHFMPLLYRHVIDDVEHTRIMRDAYQRGTRDTVELYERSRASVLKALNRREDTNA